MGGSYWRFDHIRYATRGSSSIVFTTDQAIRVLWADRPFFGPTSWTTYWCEPELNLGEFFRPQTDIDEWLPGMPPGYRWLGFSLIPTFDYEPAPSAAGLRLTEVGVPFYFIFWTTALLPVVRGRRAMRRRRMRRRVAAGCWAACGYDCRATPGRCPECGAEAGRTGVEGVT